MVLSATVLFCLLVALLLWVIIGGKGPWWIKAFLIVPTVWFSVVVGNSLPTMLGWPSPAELPEKYELIWVNVKTPNLKTGAEGRILLWVKNMAPTQEEYRWSLYKADKTQPRVHIIPYSKAMHKRANQAKGLLKQGKRVMGSNGKGGKGKGKGKAGVRGRPGQGKSGTTGGGEESDDSVGPKFYIMPPVKLPSKDGPQSEPRPFLPS